MSILDLTPNTREGWERDELLHDSPGADLFPEQWDDADRLYRAAIECYGRPVIRISMESGDLAVTIRLRGQDERTFYTQGFESWTDEYGRNVRWHVTRRDETPVAIEWTVIG